MERPSSQDPRDPAAWPRLFSVAEANALLPTLAPVLRRLRAAKTAFDDAQRRLGRLTPAMRGNGHAAEATALERRIAALGRELAAGIRAVNGHGVALKDIDLGLIDFPSPRDGRVVFLCWRLGEGPIAFWHEVDGGFAGRSPL